MLKRVYLSGSNLTTRHKDYHIIHFMKIQGSPFPKHKYGMIIATIFGVNDCIFSRKITDSAKLCSLSFYRLKELRKISGKLLHVTGIKFPAERARYKLVINKFLGNI